MPFIMKDENKFVMTHNINPHDEHILIDGEPIADYVRHNVRKYSALDLHEFMDQYFAELSGHPDDYIPKG